MKYTDLKEGDIITILEEPRMWSSALCGVNPLHTNIYPYTGEIKKLKNQGYYIAAHIGDYGWDLGEIKFRVEKQSILYEIY